MLSNFSKFIVQCPYGTSGKNCKKCAVNNYADVPGLAACKQCENGKVTEQIGSIRKSQCITPRKLEYQFDIYLDVFVAVSHLKLSNCFTEVHLDCYNLGK